MAEEFVLTDEMKATIGSTGPVSTYEVTTQGIRTFARAIGYRDAIYYDQEAAKGRGHGALPAPPGFFGMPKFNPMAPRTGGGGGRGVRRAWAESTVQPGYMGNSSVRAHG